MMVAIRAIYHNGQLQLLDPVDLEEGQEVQVQILDKQSSRKDLIGDMLVQFDAETFELDEDAILREIAEAMKGKRPLSEIIIEERQKLTPNKKGQAHHLPLISAKSCRE